MHPFNLLPPTQKTLLRWQALNRQIWAIGLYVLVFVLFSWALLMLGASMLREYNSSLSAAQLITPAENQKVSLRDINDLNQMITILNNKQPFSYVWTGLLLDLARLTPGNVHLVSFNADTETKEVVFTGIADTREDLLLFQKQIETSEYFSAIDIPPDSLTQPKDIPFSLQATFAIPSYEK